MRVMPNTPCLVGCVAAAMAAGKSCGDSHAATTSTLFNAVGKIHQVAEKLLDAVTGLSGSGPAYVFLMIEAMADGGVLSGLPRNIAQDLAAQTAWPHSTSRGGGGWAHTTSPHALFSCATSAHLRAGGIT